MTTVGTNVELGGVTQAPPADRPHDRHFRTDHLMADLKGRSVRGGIPRVEAGTQPPGGRLRPPGSFGPFIIAISGPFTMVSTAPI